MIHFMQESYAWVIKSVIAKNRLTALTVFDNGIWLAGDFSRVLVLNFNPVVFHSCTWIDKICSNLKRKVKLGWNRGEIRVKQHVTSRKSTNRSKHILKLKSCVWNSSEKKFHGGFCVSLYSAEFKTLCYEMGFRLKFSREKKFAKTFTKITIWE